MSSVKRLIGAGCAAAVLALTLASCAPQNGVRQYSWYGNHPGLYSLGFQAAATEAVIKKTYGVNFYDHFGDAAYLQPTSGPCDRRRWDAFVLGKQVACELLVQRQDVDCLNAQGCARLMFDPELVRYLGQDTVVGALTDPCGALTRPSDAGRLPARPTRMGMSAQENWQIFQCEGGPIQPSLVAIDMISGVLEVSFAE